MSTQNVVVGIVVLLVIAVGGFIILSNQENASDSIMDDNKGDMTPKDSKLPTGQVEKGDSMMKEGDEDAMTPRDDAAASPTGQVQKGTYEAYSGEKLALAEKGKVVLYFHADWCPICRPLDAALKGGVPAGIHILKVDYDTATELKQKYGVTYQHTFVQVDASGKMIAKWGDAFTAADVFARVK